MIELRNITKDYEVAGSPVHALKGISLSFRQNEFAAILGPSGGGKTTLLNIIGGLDQYTSGDLIINGKSTVDFRDRDWDSYRNHSVGFVFQSYNLIPHQSVIANVELALTISGIGKKERTRRAREALEKVGLGDQCEKKPNQISGGQMQRVAIARALVNDPDILLADEPTGALDTQSSLQIMEILKEVAKDRLVVMVTHNPELAEQYANRIIRLRDGEITADSNPFNEADEAVTINNMGKSSMSFLTAFGLSLNNLMTKKGRTILVALAGSIGIIGIALIMSLSNGVNRYIDEVQKNSLSSYPLTIENSDVDMTQAMLSMMSTVSNRDKEEGYITETSVMSGMFNQVGSNNLRDFKKYLSNHYAEVDQYLSAVKYSYGLSKQIYKEDTSKGIVKVNPNNMFSRGSSSSFSSMSGYSSTFQEMIDNRELLMDQYEVVEGRWPERYDEMVLVIYNKESISDYMIYALGIRDPKELEKYISQMMNGEKVEINNEPLKFTIRDFLDLRYRLVIASDYYRYNSDLNIWEDMSDNEEYMKNLIARSLQLKIVGVITPRDGVNSTVLSPGVAYTSELTEFIIRQAADSEIVRKQLSDNKVDIFTNRSFDDINSETRESTLNFDDMISVDENMLRNAFGGGVDVNQITSSMSGFVNKALNAIVADTTDVVREINSFTATMATEMLNDYIDEHGEFNLAGFDLGDIPQMLEKQLAKDTTKQAIAKIEKDYGVPEGYLKDVLGPTVQGVIQSYYEIAQQYTDGQSAVIDRDHILELVQAMMNNEVAQQTIQDIATSLLETRVRKSVGSVMGDMMKSLASSLQGAFSVDVEMLQNAFKFNLNEEELTRIMMTFANSNRSDATADSNLRKLGYCDLDDPNSISFYLVDFDSKERFKDFISDYNDMVKKENRIVYTDITGILIASVSQIIDAISYILIAFVSVSLIVSSIMIGIITYISVLERTKEIGILRSLGASKRNVGNVFNAETFIIGLTSGVFGVVITVLLCYPINWIVRDVTGIPSITAYLPLKSAIILVVISVVLTVIAGLIPSRMAARRDPVTALRTE